MYDKVALAFIWLIKILFWINFKDVITHLEANWFDLWSYFFTWLLDVAESFICFTVELRKGSLPFCSDLFKYVWRDWKLGTSSVNNGWITCLHSWLLNCFSSICHSLSFKCPCSEPVVEVFKGFESFSTSYDLRWVVSTEESIRSLTHLLGGNTETNHSVINNSIVLKWPQIMKLFLSHFFVWWKSKNSIWFFSKSLRFIKSKELEISTFVIFKLEFELNEAWFLLVEWLDACVILPYESLKLGRSIC